MELYHMFLAIIPLMPLLMWQVDSHTVAPATDAQPMKCYHCSSTKSLADCEANQKLQENCIKTANKSSSCYISWVYEQDGSIIYGKSCAFTEICNHPGNKGKLECCDRFGCNENLLKMSSAPSLWSRDYILVILLSIALSILLTNGYDSNS